MVRSIFTILSIFVIAASLSAQNVDRVQQWRDDLAVLKTELSQKHKDLFFKLNRDEFEREAARIHDAIPTMSDAEIKIDIIRLVAMAGDGHTQVWWSADDFRLVPISFYRFSDGWFVVRAGGEYKRTLGARLVKIGDTDIEKAVEALSPFVACDNRYCLNDRLPRYLNNADFLHRAKLISNTAEARFTFEDEQKKRFEVRLGSLTAAELKNVKIMGVFDAAKVETPIYRRHPDLFYFREYLTESKTLYIVYRACKEMASLPFERFAAETLSFMDANAVERVVVDLRQNGGGKESIIRPLANGLRDRVNRGGVQVFVVIGRSTYSSANNNAYELKEKAKAIFVGEPSGQKPNHYGEVKSITLPNSKIQIGYSSNYFRRVKGDPDAIIPDLAASLSIADYLAGRDPALAAILSHNVR